MSDQWRYQLAVLSPAGHETILIPCVDLAFAEAETAHETVIVLSCESVRRIQHMLGCIVNHLNIVVPVLKQVLLGRSGYVNLLRQFLLLEVPNCIWNKLLVRKRAQMEKDEMKMKR